MARRPTVGRRDDTNPTRDPLPPPFHVGTRLRCIDGHDAYVPRVERARAIAEHPEDWARISGRGIEVTIDDVRPGHRGTGRQLRDESGPMHHDDGEPMLDATRDGYSVYHVVLGEGRLAKQSGRCIFPDSVHRWQVLPAPLVLKEGDFFKEHGPAPQVGLVLSSGPKTFDAIWLGGSTTRYRHGVRNVQLLSQMEVDRRTREHLLGEAEAAKRERKAGAGVRRGSVAPR
jgi:hypothetical protein